MGTNFETEVRIGAPPERVFAALTDVDGFGKWMKGFVRVERLTHGPFGVGTQFRETRKMFGKEASEQFEVTAYEPPRRVVLHVDGSKGATGKGEFLFEHEVVPDGSGARLVLRGDIRMPGFFARVFGPLMIGMFRKACRRDLEALKAHLESVPRG